ncbi:ABC transporter ATP-binding protein [Priestia taiwanensis]|uniref:ABC transporter ATP-binding protein n=1 Tax=Priestia taiwanensis TaxID=1347902 RepID=A0A917AWV2_9BACI|nr:ABC transporter ATP-binding protein [Priestia taiwanensis]MBM7365071.1 ABC-2 type transport system ATP-binding protein [Priestia taiwanensis]GGE83841.1 ABC transporter ATP-binding protein [Priestia taiwanensis]
MNIIETSNLTKKYGKKTVVDNISLTVKKGDIFGFLGRNGAGKSTFINMITGIIQPTAGSFKLLNETNLNKVYQKIGVLPDYSSFYDSLTALDHLKFFARINGHKLSSEEGISILSQVGLEGDADKKAGKFSFGMKKKLGIAQAIAHNPELIFLDEPTSGIDAESGLKIQKLIRQLQAEGKTIFMTSHNLNEVEKICNRIAIMKDGSIINQGTLEELKRHYMSSYQIEIKHSLFASEKTDLVPQFLDSIGTDIVTKGNTTSLIVESEDKIPYIVRAFTHNNIDIFKVNVNEPSLEEIFLDERNREKQIS